VDQPTIDGINTWFVSKAARELGLKVAVSGLGGDELFGGYPSFRTIPRWVRALAVPGRIPGLGRALRSAAAVLRPDRFGLSPKVAGMVEFGASYPGAYLLARGLFMPWELPLVLDRDLVREGLRRLRPMASIAAALDPVPATPFARVAALESALYMRNQLLRDTDWASMSHSLEVRVPLVDVALLAAVAPIIVGGAGAGKALLAASPRLSLPPAVTSRAKTGFGTPVAQWLQRSRTQQLRPYSDIPALASPACPWARRWAYSLGSAA
jgi:asparagine synthase (glutamine-hydrolysing)